MTKKISFGAPRKPRQAKGGKAPKRPKAGGNKKGSAWARYVGNEAPF